MLLALLLFFGSMSAIVAGTSPHGDEILQLNRNNAFGPRISEDIILDAVLDVPGLIKKYNYPVEEHFVKTPDGYILGMHRIPHGRDQNNVPGDRPAVLVMHGLLSSSADYVISGPGDALAYILAEEGYDVWLGNARGNHYSRRHLTLNPNLFGDKSFWQFSWDEVGNIDLPAMIDHVLGQTGKSALHYIGMSQGTTAFFVMGSMRPEYNKKIISMHALAPVAYMTHTTNGLFRLIAPLSNNIANLANFIGIGEFLPNNVVWKWIGKNVCRDNDPLQFLCRNVLFFIGGKNIDQFNTTLLPVKFGHFPAGASVRQLAHYGQSISSSMFRRYDHGLVRNLVIYGTANPPNYNLKNIDCPVFLHYSENDPLAHVNDVDRLYNELGGTPSRIPVPDENFSHIDFAWGINAKTLVYDTVIDIMKKFNEV